MNNGHKQRTAFVTGGSGEIGSQICVKLSKAGYRVAVGYYTAEQRADELCREIGATAVYCNAAEYSSVKDAYGRIKGILGEVDTLVNCVGAESYKLISDETEQSIDSLIKVNLNGVIYACAVFSPDMVSAKFGRIINISSVWGVCGAAMETVYSAAKAGVIGFTKALSSELAPSGITVNCISPGFIDTKMNSRFNSSEREAILQEIPSCRFGSPDDVAAAVGFLVGEQASYVTGQNITVSGGYKNI